MVVESILRYNSLSYRQHVVVRLVRNLNSHQLTLHKSSLASGWLLFLKALSLAIQTSAVAFQQPAADKAAPVESKLPSRVIGWSFELEFEILR